MTDKEKIDRAIKMLEEQGVFKYVEQAEKLLKNYKNDII